MSFGFPGISHLIQPTLELSHEPGHRCLFSTTAVRWKSSVACVWRSGYKTAKQKKSIKKYLQQKPYTYAQSYKIFFSFHSDIFQPVNCGELLADVIERQDVYHRAIAWIGIKNYEWPLSSNQFAFSLSHMQIHTLLLFLLRCVTHFAKKSFLLKKESEKMIKTTFDLQGRRLGGRWSLLGSQLDAWLKCGGG